MPLGLSWGFVLKAGAVLAILGLAVFALGFGGAIAVLGLGIGIGALVWVYIKINESYFRRG